MTKKLILVILLVLWALCITYTVTGCFEKPQSVWHKKYSYPHDGKHEPVEYRRWDTVIILYTGKPLNAEAVELRCAYIGCPVKDTFYLIKY